MSCCGKNNKNFFAHNHGICCDNYDNDCCCDNNYNNNCDDDLTGISCPFQNNNDCCCEKSLREVACKLTNQRVIIHVDGCKMCVVIVGVGSCFLKTVNPCTQKIVYFNFNRIDNIEDVLPRCY